MRIYLIPLSRNVKALHCHSTIAPSSSSYLNRATTWASKKWENLGKSEPGSMKIKLYVTGSRMLERIEHKETFFKEIPAKEDVTATTMIPFMYPSKVSENHVRAEFKDLIEQRIPYHRKYMIYSALCVPVTSLFTIVPLIPNIPFFYNAFRLWSHWKAYNGAKHLDSLIKAGTIEFQPSDILNLGLAHDPEFAVFFWGSNQLSRKRHARHKPTQQDPNAPVIAESSGEVTPTLNNFKDSSTVTAGLTGAAQAKALHNTTTAKSDDPMSVTDHVALEGFLTDAEVAAICEAFKEAPQMSREIKRARFQEADKFVKEKLLDKSRQGKKEE
ncbi:hypothetical protein BX616_004926 [Lobosporangium transversale]|uniref:Mitochondrial K+-H+ exchange-related-domain-containing protein n=1 Tax=Lobosporangium transversale TaxID=64571 RepID=A0A1Y2G715_9FUNG|nr:mitochondrial K+-H+ exchange-related-domain-containing protein [Lobosporangium transversale]KAF9915974.1 hypothetical protein BX616_004926 [Lobosporangium transversale]ORY95095.1 mitochondrial K+-H+ exchange-related-domain-containing protein [Lobosporangium transversale]|eukprot:XP_021875304.1 mitochondrial K+-H+ exchange-related-domain-containing protein [Lobosporangium transversale]